MTNNPDAPGLKIARSHGISTIGLNRKSFGSLMDFKTAIYDEIMKISPDIILLAGFMQIIEKGFVEKTYGKLINIHPSLLPDLPGLDTHQRAIEAKLKNHGCTVHFVDPGVDTGPIIAQASLKIASDENHEELAKRVLALEHNIYPWVVDQVSLGKIRLEGRKVVYSPDCIAEAAKLNFSLPQGV